MRDAAHHEGALEVVEPGEVLEDEPELPYEFGVLEVLLEGEAELGDEEGVGGGSVARDSA